jgi:hypothetical protein
MQSNGASDLPEFPEPTPEERDALERVRELNRMTPAEFLEFLSQFTKNHPPSRETNSPDDEPFEL